jgi:hypothetical protein
LSYGSESLHALARGDYLIRAASKQSSFPAKLSGSKQLTDLVNYVLDFTLPQDADQKYSALIQTWGNLLLNRESQILKGTYNFSTIKSVYTTVTRTINQSDNVQYKFIVEQKVGNDDAILKHAVDMLITLPPSLYK